MLFLLTACSVVPTLRVSHPWTRSLSSNDLILPSKSIHIRVEGVTQPLLGEEQLVSNNLHSILEFLIKRRGFVVSNNNYEYVMKLIYRTERNDKMKYASGMTSLSSQRTVYSTSYAVGATTGLGVSVARAVGAVSSSTLTVGEQYVNQVLSYTHTISIEVENNKGDIVWKGESTWDTNELNLINRITPALQLILANLPADKSYVPQVAEVKGSHVYNYYLIECIDVWYTCPALPYKIFFTERPKRAGDQNRAMPRSISNPNALEAYVDLIQTAEFALPTGSERNWSNPLEPTIWTSATLGGQYLLGPSKTPVNVIIKLEGKKDGYLISEASLVSDKEYAEFNSKLEKWRDALRNFYDVYMR